MIRWQQSSGGLGSARRRARRARLRNGMLAGVLLLCPGALLAALLLQPAAVRSESHVAAPVGQVVGIAGNNLTPADLDRVAGLGLRYVRSDFSWAGTERKPGTYDFGTYLEFAREVHARGMRPLFILDYGNPVHTPFTKIQWRGRDERRTSPPVAPEQIKAYSDWAAAAAKAFAPYDPIWEVWNEPDHPRFWPPKPDAAAYGRMALAACQAIRGADGSAEVYGPAASKWVDGAFLTALAGSKAVTCFSRISVHPYQMTGDVTRDAALWGGLRRRIVAGGQVKAPKIANSEWGRPIIGRVDGEAQARYLVRTLVSALAADVAPNVWYSWKDAGSNPDYDQHNFGLLQANGTPKPSYFALQTLLKELGAMRYVCPVQRAGVEGAIFSGGNGAAALVWAKAGAALLEPAKLVPSGWKLAGLVDMTGKALPGGEQRLGNAPVYLRLRPAAGGARPALTCPKPA
ncbi:hypothetical protein [Novosphingobium sp.]|uniref:hypothetical protein n=1 Tax=Novosphingobium sp. TaxID=1874826 RepID=UPI002FDF6BC0